MVMLITLVGALSSPFFGLDFFIPTKPQILNFVNFSLFLIGKSSLYKFKLDHFFQNPVSVSFLSKSSFIIFSNRHPLFSPLHLTSRQPNQKKILSFKKEERMIK